MLQAFNLTKQRHNLLSTKPLLRHGQLFSMPFFHNAWSKNPGQVSHALRVARHPLRQPAGPDEIELARTASPVDLFRDDIKRSEAGGSFSKDAACGLYVIEDLLTALDKV